MPLNRFIMLWGLVFFCTVTTTLAQGLMIRNYNVKDGLANATVYAAVQDKDGFIWYRSTTGNQWVRADIVVEVGECKALPTV